MRCTRPLTAAVLLMATACASPQERAYKEAVKDYKRSQAAAAEYTRVNVGQLIAATKTYRASQGRWPRTLIELSDFAFDNHLPFDFPAFNEVTFAALDDGSLQVHYDMNCERFSQGHSAVSQTGSVNVRTK